MWPSCATSSRGTSCWPRDGTDERLVRQAMQHERFPELVELPEELHPDVLAALRRARDRRALEPSGRGAGVRVRADHDRHHRHRLGQVAVLPAARRWTWSRARPATRALFLYPSKALAQDQARSLHAFGLKRARPAIYDGDTPREQRADLRRKANLVLTNPDMLHLGILPNHAAWEDFLATSQVVVIDEAHVYRGVFGSHVANVLRRLRRLCELYGTSPRFLLASATIANPGELASRLTGLDDVDVISRDGSPGTRRTIAMWNPPVTDEATMARRSPLAEAADLLASLVIEGARTIVFMKSRKAVELMARFTVLELERQGHPELASRIAPYRAGYTAQQRRELEGRLVSGRAARRRRHRRAGAGDRHRRRSTRRSA